MNFEGKTAIVTGAARGIGAACARAFALHGARVVLADIIGEECETMASEIASSTRAETMAVQSDVSVPADCDKLMHSCLEQFGQCDILLNNAGIIESGSILDLSIEDFDRVLAVNLRSVFLLSRHMVEKQVVGSIINMSSTNAVVAIPNQLAYGASKGGIAQMTKTMAMALAPHKIRVNAIGPGSINTDILKVVMADDEARQMILSRTPMGRVGEPEEVAKVAIFLASDYSSYLTGQTIYPDGGRLALNYTAPLVEDM